MEKAIGESADRAREAILENIDVLAEQAVDAQCEVQPEIWQKYGEAGYKKSLEDGRYHFRYLAEALGVHDQLLFLDYVAWLKVLFAALKFPPEALPVALKCMDEVLNEHLAPPVASVAHSYVDAALAHLPDMPDSRASHIRPGAPLCALARQYLESVLGGRRNEASRLILDAVDKGTPVRDIYLHVFQPCQREVGRLWQMNQVSVAQEHFVTAVTQLVMSQLYPRIFAPHEAAGRLVATCVGGELHEIGVRMLADFFEMDGWNTYYLGASTPSTSLLTALVQHKAQVLAVSATISFHVSGVKELVQLVHADSRCTAVKVLVGGYPFNVAEDLWQRVGADGYARSAEEAVPVARQLLEMSG